MPVLVDLWAAWCGPCRMVSPALEQLARERAGQVKLVKVDVDKAPGLSQRFDVKAVPTLLVLKDGEVLARQSGAAPANVLRDWLDRALTADRR
jgi:thioredoxin 2